MAEAASSPSPSPLVRARALLRSVWTARQTPWWVVVLAALAFALRKPWALHTPQLYAEDGTVFLTQQEQFDFRVFLQPYMGYLHTLPRLIAWLAAHLADPAYWPAIYNGSCFALTVFLLFRIASPRLDVPGKPVLLFSFALAAHTGEVPLNITNLQWIAAFFLLVHPLLSPPATALARVVDCALILLVGLTGPFSVVLLPVFFWAWWRERRADALLPLLLLTACAAVQLAYLLHADDASPAPTGPFNPLAFFSVIGSRLVVWSLFGSAAVAPLPAFLRAAIALAFLGALAAWTLRPQPRRPQHLTLWLGFAAVSAACFYRTRPDMWAYDNLFYGDRYFYISRVLLFWFLAWACVAPRRTVAWTATALIVLGFTVHLPSYHYPTPPDYHWADHVEPIRRGVPASIETLPEGWTMDYVGRPVRP